MGGLLQAPRVIAVCVRACLLYSELGDAKMLSSLHYICLWMCTYLACMAAFPLVGVLNGCSACISACLSGQRACEWLGLQM